MSAKVNKTTFIHKCRVFNLVRENVTLDNGVTIDIDIVRHPGAAAIVPFIDDNTIIMIRQYRHAIGKYIWEIPAGTLDEGESPLECAKRELTEETGYEADQWKKLGEITPLPAYSDECIHIYLAMELTNATQHLDEDEMLEIHKVPWKKALAMISNGEIQDGKTISSLCLAQLAYKLKAP